MLSDSITVFKSGVAIGVLKIRSDNCEFIYYQDFSEKPKLDRLTFDPSVCWQKPDEAGAALLRFFWGLLPEGERMQELADRLGVKTTDHVSILNALGRGVIGDVKIYSASKETDFDLPRAREVDFYQHFQNLQNGKLILPGEEFFPGQQPKFSTSTLKFSTNVVKNRHKYFIKLDTASRKGLAENEAVCMELAGKCGIDCAETRLVKDCNANVALLVKRFDCVWNNTDDCFSYSHLEDSCQVLGVWPEQKDQISLNDIANGISRISPVPAASILKILQRYAFSYVIGNGEYSCRDISMMQRPQSDLVELSPAYDLVCTCIYGDESMALSLNGQANSFKRGDLLEFAREWQVPEAVTERMLDSLISRILRFLDLLWKIPMDSSILPGYKKLVLSRMKDLT